METLRKPRKIFLLSVAILLAVILAWQQYAQAKKRSINYFPQEYSLDMIESDYKTNNQNLFLGETACSSGDIAKEYDICLNCEQLRKGCPNCCFDNKDPVNGLIACSPGCTNCNGVCNEGKDGIPPAPIDQTVSKCDAGAPLASPTADTCQGWTSYNNGSPTKKLCPEKLAPKEAASGVCTAGDEGPWYCVGVANPTPYPACPYYNKATQEKKKCSADPYTTVLDSVAYTQEVNGVLMTTYTSSCNPSNVPNCYKITANSAFRDCWTNCQKDAETWERCSQKKVCCTEDSCGVKEDINKNKKLVSDCPTTLCKDRQNKETGVCASPRNSTYCQKKISEYNDWIADGRAVPCFKPIDTKFKYTFVGKKHEAVTFIWQVFCEPQKKAGQNSLDKKFYTILKIYEVKSPEGRATFNESDLVFFSMIHQKDFNSEFALNAATRFEPTESGKVYNAVVCYFIPPVENADLQMKINDQQIFALRNRE